MISRFTHQLKVILLLFDAAALVVALWIAYGVRHGFTTRIPHEYLWAGLLIGLLMIISFQRLGLYKMQSGFAKELILLVKGVVVSLLLAASITFFYRTFSFSRTVYLVLGPVLMGSVVLARISFRHLSRKLGRMRPIQRNALVIGCGTLGKYIIAELVANAGLFHVVGFLDDDPQIDTCGTVGTLGGTENLERVLQEKKIHDVFVSISLARSELVRRIIHVCESRNVNWSFVPDLYGLPIATVHLDIIGTIPLLGPKHTNIIGVNHLIKRTLDVTLSSVFVLLSAPFMLAIALAIKLSSPGPVFHVQERIGLHGQPFRFLKFRTMVVNNDTNVHKAYAAEWIRNNHAHAEGPKGKKIYKIERDPRITKVGHWLRKFSLDELPQFYNVLKGDMSIVGPRPALAYEVEMYEPWHKRRFQVLPGITGLWQVNGRNGVSFEEMLNLDIAYLNNWSLEGDIRIILKTVPAMFFSKAF